MRGEEGKGQGKESGREKGKGEGRGGRGGRSGDRFKVISKSLRLRMAKRDVGL